MSKESDPSVELKSQRVMSKESDANQRLTTSIVITNVTNIQIKLLAEDIQQLQKQMGNRKRDRERKKKVLLDFNFTILPISFVYLK